MELQEHFESIGGRFLTPVASIGKKLSGIKGYVFDWDGVFNDGIKDPENGSPFSEADAMGTNMLRFSHWLKHQQLPTCFIISGAVNPTAVELAKREQFDAVLTGMKDKLSALQKISETYGIHTDQLTFFYDDIIDLGLAERVGIRCCVQRASSPLFRDYVVRQQLADYLTGSEGGQHAVREICELLIALNGNYEQTVTERAHYSESYQSFLELRNKVETVVLI